MRLVTFNVLHGRSLSDGQVDGDRFCAAVRQLDADVLALQELDRGQLRSGRLHLAAVAASATGAVAWRFAAAAVQGPDGGWREAATPDGDGGDGGNGPAYGVGGGDGNGPAYGGRGGGGNGPAYRDGGRGGNGPAYGVALLSRYPVSRWYEVRLPALPVRSPVFLPGSGRVQLLQDEPRVALVAVLRTPAGRMTVAATHLSFVPGWNAAQLTGLVHRLRRLPRPVLLLGDLNLPGPLPALLTGWRPLARTATFPAPGPRLQIDHVLADGRLPPVRSVSTPAVDVSDHRPLVVDLAT